MAKQFEYCWVKDKIHYFFTAGLLRAFSILLSIKKIQEGVINTQPKHIWMLYPKAAH